MRLLRPFVLGLSLLSSYVAAQEVDADALNDSKQGYQVCQLLSCDCIQVDVGGVLDVEC